jgi:protein-disulfide isomerase
VRDPVEGNPIGRDVIVEFIDYGCPTCKASFRPLESYLEQNPQAVLRFKQFPILGPESVIAARVALAINNIDPKVFVNYHRALMGRSGPLTKDAIDTAIQATKLPLARVYETANSVAITEQLADVNDIAKLIGLTGTPAFIIHNTIQRGIPTPAALNAALSE